MPKDTVFTLPTVHMNGTGHRTLTEGYDAADDALEAFVTAFGNIEFNARDYYPQGPEAWPQARDHRHEMHRHLAAIKEYMNQHRTALYDQAPQPPRTAAGA